MLYVFQDCELDMRLYALRRAGARIPLGPKAFSVLAYLIQHRDRVVRKQELSALLWPSQCVSGHGYRFIATVEEHPVAPTAGTVLAVSATPLLPNGQVLDPTYAPPVALPHASEPDRFSQHTSGDLPMRDGEVWEVTVLCGALAHTEVLATRLDPATMHHLVHGFFELALRAV